MAKKLWSVTVACEFEMPVYAETQDEAEEIASRHYEDEIACDDAMEFDAREVSSARTMPLEFRGSIPWGADGDETCEDLLSRDGA